MTIEELKKGEHETVEYKQDIPKVKEKYLKTAVAFANGAGGKLIFGVENDSWEVIGFSDEEIFKKYDSIANSIFDACTPSIVPIMTIEEIDHKKIIVAQILAGMTKPYYLRKDGMMEGTYIRIAGVTRKAEPYMIKELQLEGTNRGFDALQVAGDEIPEKDIDSLCKRMYNHALERCKTDEQRQEQKKVTKSQLIAWKILVECDGKCYPTNAWKLLTGDTEESLSYAFIQMAAFKGNTRSVFLDKKEAVGPIDQQIEDAMLFVKKHINLGSRIAGVYREDYYELPIDSIREMISNAVCHRSYLSPGSIQIAIYDDRLEVTSPGRLSPDLTIEQIIEGNSRVRNAAIGAAFYYMHIIEKWGSGIPRLFEDARQYGLGDPVITDFGTSFRISISRKPFETDPFGVRNPVDNIKKKTDTKTDIKTDTKTGTKTDIKTSTKTDTKTDTKTRTKRTETKKKDNIEKLIIELIKKDPKITLDEIATSIGFSKSGVRYVLTKMRECGKIGREGAKKGGKWIAILNK